MLRTARSPLASLPASPFARFLGLSLARSLAVPVALLAACAPCDDSCNEYVELSFVSANATGMFASTRYEFVVDGDERVASCEIDVATAIGEVVACQGDAEIRMSDGATAEDGSTGGGGGGTTSIVLRWEFAPTVFDLVVRDDASALVLSNTLTPAYQDQGEKACDGQCERFESEIVLPQ